MSYANKLEECINFLRTAASDYGYYCGVVGDKDKEKCDLEHELELAAESEADRGQVALNLQNVLRERRECKDRIASSAPIAEYLNAHPKLLSELGQVLGRIRKEEKYQEQRSYNPRIRTDLTIGNGKEKQ